MAATHGGEMVAAMPAAEGVDTVFGIIDGTYFGLCSNLEKHGIRLVSPRHETSALHRGAGSSDSTLGTLASSRPGVRIVHER